MLPGPHYPRRRYPAQFFYESRFLGTGEMLGRPATLHTNPPQNLAYCCPICTDVWGRIVADSDGEFHILTAPCRKHFRPGYTWEVPGSMWPRIQDFFPVDISPEVLQWELNRHLEWHDRKVSNV